MAPDGGALFTSLFDDADHTGDTLHVLLSEAGDEPTAQLELLTTTFDGGILTDTRGRPISVGAYLARRFVTYQANGPTTTPTFRRWATVGPNGGEPRLTTAELVSLTGALAVDRFGGAPQRAGVNQLRLLDGLMAEVSRAAAAGEPADRDVQRLGFFAAAGGAGLVAAAQSRDETNKQPLRGAAEAKNVGVAVAKGPNGLAALAADVATSGTSRSRTDNTAIELLRTNNQLEQSELNDGEAADLRARLAAVVAGLPVLSGDGSVDALFASGASLVPTVTAEQLRARREAEIRAAATGLPHALDALLPTATSPTTAATKVSPFSTYRGGDPYVYDPVSGGSIDFSRVTKPQPHEVATAERLMQVGHHVDFLAPTQLAKTADA